MDIKAIELGQRVLYCDSQGKRKAALVTATPQTVSGTGHELDADTGELDVLVLARTRHYERHAVPCEEPTPGTRSWVPFG